ncbi:PLP-dependent aminotransferase family protein [Niallia oryzisoli]|uniref:MocR-like pyridoxine biosynthesis transcription factor PdxR n=1 Tax=Niallia oryzisoli TaxID=1737571 RepID=UPI0037355D88
MKKTIFAFKEDTPKYKQIYEQFRGFIEEGVILPNEPLPSIRELADSLQVSRNTTLTAYEQLVAEGYIRSAGRSGYFANELEPDFAQAASKGFQQQNQLEKVQIPVQVDFRAGAVDQSYFPLKAWRKYSNQVLSQKETYKYGDRFGEECLRQQIAAYLLQSRGVKTEEDAIIIGSNTQQLLMNLGFILREEFQSMIVEDPGYDGVREAFQLHDFAFETLPITEEGADFSILEQMKSRMIYITPSHHCPYGISMSVQQRQRLIQWAMKREGYLIEDDYDSEFRYTQHPFPALASIDSEKVIYLGNFSKSFLPGLRLSYMVLPQPLLQHYKHRFRHFESTVSLVSQLTMALFMEAGEWNRHIKRMRVVYKKKVQYLVTELQKQFPNSISIIGEESGLYLLIKVLTEHSEQWLIEQALLNGVKVYPTSIYYVHHHPDQPMIRLGFANLTLDEIQLGVQLLKQAWSEIN